MQSRSEIIPEEKNPKLSRWDIAYALNMAIACLITYWIMTHTLSRFVDESSDFLGGMWAVDSRQIEKAYASLSSK